MKRWPAVNERWGSFAAVHADDERVLTYARRSAGPFNIGLRAYRSDFEQPAHAHGYAVVDLNLAGGGFETYAGRERLGVAGEIDAYAPGVEHTFRSGPNGIRTMHVSLAGESIQPLLSGAPGADRGIPVDPTGALRPALGVLGSMMRPGGWDPVHVECLCWELAAAAFAPPGTSGADLAWLPGVIEMLESVTDRPVGLGEIAAAAGVHRGTVARGFRAATGRTPGQFHRRVRLRESVKHLAAGESPAAAARSLGFADQSHLTRWLRTDLGVTPAALARLTGGPARAGRGATR